MLTRIDSFHDLFQLDEEEFQLVQRLAEKAAERAEGMTHYKDYVALGAIAQHFKPRSIFEIGTYLGVTSDFLLELLPESKVVSIAFQNSKWNLFRRNFNNSELRKDSVGSQVAEKSRSRFTQLFGNSHELVPIELVNSHGEFDLVFIDGDHSAEGVRQDTELAINIMSKSGVICWHDANPKEKYLEVRQYLEKQLPLKAIATQDNYIGGIACWSPRIEAIIEGELG